VDTLQIATWNVNSLKARLDFVQLWLRERQPDVVALQELKLPDDDVPIAAFEELGYQVAAHGQPRWNGVAVLSRQPIEVVRTGLPGQEEMGARLVDVKTAGLSFVSVYVPNGKTLEHEDFGHKLDWLDALASYLAEHHDPQEPLVVGGDFNLCPDAVDSWHGQSGGIFHTDDERGRFARLQEWGLIDLYRELNPDEQAYSWWDYRAGAFHKKQGLRIDFVLGTAAVRARARASVIERDWRKKHEGLTPSDHAPVIVELEA
jgi:exodeoxyribonuclease-3